MKKVIISLIGLLSLQVSFAQTPIVVSQVSSGPDGSPLFRLLGIAQELVSRGVPFLAGLAMLAFFYGLVLFIWKGREGGETLENSKKFMIYSVLALFVMMSIWGIIGLLQNVLGVDPSAKVHKIDIPS